MLDQTILDIVRKAEDDDQQGNTTISKYVNYNQRETIEKVDAYINSRHTSGETDSMGREKPFFNIVTAARNIWYRATDIDRKDIRIRATKKADYVLAFVMTILITEWMRKAKFGTFLNEWGRTLATYGSAISKFVEKGGELVAEVAPWNRMITDPVDFDNNVRIEVLWFTPAQLRARKEYDQDMVEDLIDARKTRTIIDGNQDVDTKSEYIQVFEVHGDVSKQYLTGKESDEYTYEQQMHVISYIGKKDGAGNDEHDEFTLYKGKEVKDPYEIAHLIKEDGRTVSIGSVEHLFEAQWMMNHNKKVIKDQLDLASKLIFQTSDGNFVGQNVLSSIENGQIMIHQANQPLTEMNNSSHDIGALQAYGAEWKSLGNEINGINEAMTTAPKSGTAWRQTEAALQEAHSLFELMRENKGLAIESMFRNHIIPHLKKKMDTTEEISALLDEQQLKKIDSMFVPAEATKQANKVIIDDILNKKPEDIENGNLFTPEQQQEVVAKGEAEIQNQLNKTGNQRFIKPSDIKDKTWKEALKDFEWDVEVDVTGEDRDTEAILETLKTVFQVVAGLQGQPMSPELKVIFNRLLTITGAISPMEMPEATPVAQPQPMPSQEDINKIK